MISIHALLAESDFRGWLWPHSAAIFLSTLSLRRATCNIRSSSVAKKFLSTLSLRRATCVLVWALSRLTNFYPRSPCGERPSMWAIISRSTAHFYPRSPCGERPEDTKHKIYIAGISIHALLAESDQLPEMRVSALVDFYPRSPCGERLSLCSLAPCNMGISIHALLAESDVTARIIDPTYGKISIHALLAESDPFSRSGPMTHRYFYPRSPCGERRILGRWVRYGEQFLSTLSLRRATA